MPLRPCACVIPETHLQQADPDGLYLFMLVQYPYMMTPDQVAEFTGMTGQEIRKLLNRGELQGGRIGVRWLAPKLGLLNYLLRHTLATLNLANGENIKTVSVLMGHASSGYTLDLYAGYVPNTGIGIGSRYMKFLRDATYPKKLLDIKESNGDERR